jgi:hypothetical protein
VALLLKHPGRPGTDAAIPRDDVFHRNPYIPPR